MSIIDIYVSAADLIDMLVGAGILDEAACQAARREHGSREIAVTGEFDGDKLVEESSTVNLIAEAKSRWDYDGQFDGLDTEPFAEALAYARSGDLVLAEAMAVRAFGGDHDLRPIERVLQV